MHVLAIERFEKKVGVNWEFTFPTETASLLSAGDEAEVQDIVRSTSFKSPSARYKQQEEWRRLGFMLRLTITDDLGTEYENVSGGGSSSSPMPKWTSTFVPAIPRAAALLLVHHGDTVFEVPLP